MIPTIIFQSARMEVEKQAASLGELASRGGAQLGKGVGSVFGAQTGNVLRFAPTAVGAAGGAYLGSRRPDVEKGKATRGQRLRGALVGGLAGGALGHVSGVGQAMQSSLAERMAPITSQPGLIPFGSVPPSLTPAQAATVAAGQMGGELGRTVGEAPGKALSWAGGNIRRGAGHVAHTVMHPIESVENVAHAAWDPLKQAVTSPSTVKSHFVEQVTNPLGAVMMGLEGKRAIDNLTTTEDPTGRQRGLGERVLGSAGNLAGGLAYGAYKGSASQNNPITKFVGSTIGAKATGSGAAALGRKLDTLRGFKGNPPAVVPGDQT